jgi:hypothetical protein
MKPKSTYFDDLFGPNRPTQYKEKLYGQKIQVGDWKVKIDDDWHYVKVVIIHNPIKGPIWFDLVRRLYHEMTTMT